MKKISYSEYKATLKELGVSYLGRFSQSAKMVLNEKAGKVITYSLYLAPANMSGYEVCPFSSRCRDLCLSGSGRNKGDIIAHGIEGSVINRSRIKKTHLFFENRELFMRLLCYELEKTQRYAKKRGMGFSVRLNCTSDISPLAFKVDGKNILEMYPNVTFYDYTKVPNRVNLVKQYTNYHLTFSYDGGNWETCEKFLMQGINVAVVFESSELPIAFRGYRIIDMTKTDLRYLDPKSNDGEGFVGYLHFHRPASLYKSGRYERPNTPFVITEDDPEVLYAFKCARSIDE